MNDFVCVKLYGEVYKRKDYDIPGDSTLLVKRDSLMLLLCVLVGPIFMKWLYDLMEYAKRLFTANHPFLIPSLGLITELNFLRHLLPSCFLAQASRVLKIYHFFLLIIRVVLLVYFFDNFNKNLYFLNLFW